MKLLLSRRRPAPQAHPFWRFGFPAVVVVAGLCVLLLAQAAGRAVLNRKVDPVLEEIALQSHEPGYLELVGVTPTLLSVHTHEGRLTGLALLARTGIDAGGGIVLLPADLVVRRPGTANEGELLSDVYARGGVDEVELVAESLFGIGFDEAAEVSTETLALALEPAAPVPYLLVDELTAPGSDGAPVVVFEAGRLDLSASSAAAVYGLRTPNEADFNRVQRQRVLWESWLDVVRRSDDPVAVSPSPALPLSEFVRVLGAGTAVVEVPPLQSVVTDPASAPRYLLGAEGEAWLHEEILELVPRPRQPQSFLRPRVQLLDGIGDPAVRDGLIDDIISAGGVVTVIGNAAEFGIDTTRFAYHRPELVNDPITNSIAIELGVQMALIELGEATPEVVDITVTVGSDQAAR